MPEETVATQDPSVPTTEGKPADGQEPEKPAGKPDIQIPKARFDEVSKRAQAYERFGTPEEIAAAYNALAYYKEVERQAIEEAERSKSGEPTDETAKKLAEAREILYGQVDPELKQSKEQAKAAHEYVKTQQDRCRRVATRETKAILSESGMDDSDEAVVRLGRQLSPYFDDPDLNDDFWGGGQSTKAAVRQAHKAWLQDVKKGIPKEPDKVPEPQTRLPRGPTPTGGSPPSGRTPPDTALMGEKDFEAHIKAKLKAGAGR